MLCKYSYCILDLTYVSSRIAPFSCLLITQVKKQQDHILWTLEGKAIEHVLVDIADPRHAEDKKFMNANANPRPGEKMPKPPQIFCDDELIGVRTI